MKQQGEKGRKVVRWQGGGGGKVGGSWFCLRVGVAG